MNNDWQKFIDEKGDFEFPKYLYKTHSDLMKLMLDFGTLVCNDPNKLRAYKERVKSSFKQKWFDIANSLEYFGIISPCGCSDNDFCSICGGSRFRLDESFTADEMRQFSLVLGASSKVEIAEKLQKGLVKALIEVDNYKIGDSIGQA